MIVSRHEAHRRMIQMGRIKSCNMYVCTTRWNLHYIFWASRLNIKIWTSAAWPLRWKVSYSRGFWSSELTCNLISVEKLFGHHTGQKRGRHKQTAPWSETYPTFPPVASSVVSRRGFRNYSTVHTVLLAPNVTSMLFHIGLYDFLKDFNVFSFLNKKFSLLSIIFMRVLA